MRNTLIVAEQSKHSTIWFPKASPQSTIVTCHSHGQFNCILPWEVYYYLHVKTGIPGLSIMNDETQLAMSMVEKQLQQSFTCIDVSFAPQNPAVFFESKSYYLVIKNKECHSFLVHKVEEKKSDKIMMFLTDGAEGKGVVIEKEKKEEESKEEEDKKTKKGGKGRKKKEKKEKTKLLLGEDITASDIGDIDIHIPSKFFLMRCVENSFSGFGGNNFKKNFTPTWDFVFYYINEHGIKKREDGHLCEPISTQPNGPFEKPICYRCAGVDVDWVEGGWRTRGRYRVGMWQRGLIQTKTSMYVHVCT